jgi:hypothetical protein
MAQVANRWYKNSSTLKFVDLQTRRPANSPARKFVDPQICQPTNLSTHKFVDQKFVDQKSSTKNSSTENRRPKIRRPKIVDRGWRRRSVTADPPQEQVNAGSNPAGVKGFQKFIQIMNAFCKLICIVGTHLRKKWK